MSIEQRVLVSAIIIEDHKVLMQKRTDDLESHKDKFHLIYFGYLCEIVGGDIHNQDDEGDISDIGWFDIRNLDKSILIRGTLPPVEAGYKIWLGFQKNDIY